MTADQVPPAVTAAFTTRYPNATIHQVEREQEDSGVVYKFDFLTGKQEARAWFTETGQFIGDEAK